MTAAAELSVQTDPTPLDKSKHQLSPFLPREPENFERKRPLAIQELLEKKRARLAHHGISNGNNNEEEAIGKTNQNINNKGKKAEINGHMCNHDSETNSSSSSTNYNIVDKSFNYLLKKAVSDSERHFFTESQFLFAFEENKNNLAKESTIIDDEEDYQKITENQRSSKSNPLKCSPGIVEINESLLSKSVPHDRIFATIPGRLSLLSNVVKYKMTVGEVKRRLMGPESFNFSLLGALLRRAKMPEKSQLLVEELSQVGLAIPRGRRRLSQITLLSALTEAEATQFAKDFKKIAESDFPAKEMAMEVLQQNNIRKVQNFHIRLENLSAALKLTMEFLELLYQDRSPVMETNAEQILPNKLQGSFSNFSMLTHGFGNFGVRVGISCFKSFLEHQIKMIEDTIAI